MALNSSSPTWPIVPNWPKWENCPRVATILAPGESLPEGDIDFRAAVAAASTECEPVMRKGSDLFMMMSTSGTAGLPKGVPVPLRCPRWLSAPICAMPWACAATIFLEYRRSGLGLWALLCRDGSLLLGVPTILNEGGFTAESTL